MENINIHKKNSMICRFMSGKIIPFKMPDAIVNTWQECEIDFVNGLDSDTNVLRFHSDWNWLMAVWNKIISMNSDDSTVINESNHSISVEIDGYSIIMITYSYVDKYTGWKKLKTFHTCKANTTGLYTSMVVDCKNMMEVYYKTIIDFIKFYYETL